jgi:hypothetical protein
MGSVQIEISVCGGGKITLLRRLPFIPVLDSCPKRCGFLLFAVLIPSNRVAYNIDDIDEIFPCCRYETDGSIRVHFSQEFLTYLWTYSYFAITEFEGNIQKKAKMTLDKYEAVNREMRERAHKLYNWGTSVCSNPNPNVSWPGNYPSPFPFSSLPPQEIGYCLFANNICILSALFCVFHEFGHVVLGHLDLNHTKQHEIDADSFAARLLLNTDKADKTSVSVAMIVALESELLDFDNPAQRFNNTHPDALCRVDNVLNLLNESGYEGNKDGLLFLKALFLKEYCLNCNIVEKEFFEKTVFQSVEDAVSSLEAIINDC